jgi:predicted nucleic acid-binding Zn ribbon protein
MADEADMAQERMEAEAELLARKPRPKAMPEPTGLCIFCGAPAEHTPHFCSTDCASDWDRENKIRRAQGLA